ncbi:hypothetical protein AMJ44_10615, partial [candidate division WOR-1 bacterium DG_54_3]
DSSLKTGAAWALGRSGDRSIIPLLEKELKTGLYAGKASAAEALIRIRGLKKDSEEYKQLYAYQLIEKRKWRKVIRLGNSAIPALKAAVVADDEGIRDGAIRTLGKMKDKEALSALDEALKHQNPFVRWEALNALEKKGESAILLFKKALNDRDHNVRAKAAETLIKLQNLDRSSDEYRRLYAYQLIAEGKWEEVIGLGKAALPALEAAENKGNEYNIHANAIEVLEKILK